MEGMYVGNLTAQPDQPDRPLDRLGVAADRLGKLGYLVEEYLDRFHPTPKAADTTGIKTGNGGGHMGNINRLFDNIDRLESAIHQLSSIG